MGRSVFDLSFPVLDCGEIGRLKTIGTLVVCAGDSLEVDLQGVWRLSPLRRHMTFDAAVDVFAFYIPFRHIYGEDFTDFILGGVDEGKTFTGVSFAAGVGDYLGINVGAATTIPTWLPAGYNRIWNRFFRAPTDGSSERADTAVPTAQREVKYGIPVGYLPNVWSTGIDTEITAADHQVAISSSKLDILELDRVKGRYKTEVDREWFGQRYYDILQRTWGSRVNIDADQRPELVMRNRFWLSGMDVDGAGDANLGRLSGKSAGVGGMRHRRRYFPEHGVYWIMACLRFPAVHKFESHPFQRLVDFSYKDIAGDPSVLAREAPVQLKESDWFSNGGNNDLGKVPYGQQYRYSAAVVHSAYRETQGFPLLDKRIDSKDDARYMDSAEYDEIFASLEFAHWQLSAICKVAKFTRVPDPLASIYAGV